MMWWRWTPREFLVAVGSGACGTIVAIGAESLNLPGLVSALAGIVATAIVAAYLNRHLPGRGGAKE